ncbi:MAG: hypothetical protein ACKVOQ_12830 [Cyclobacteriaceae bacterium]
MKNENIKIRLINDVLPPVNIKIKKKNKVTPTINLGGTVLFS